MQPAPPPRPLPPPPPLPPARSGTSGGTIALIIVGVFAAVLVIVALVVAGLVALLPAHRGATVTTATPAGDPAGSGCRWLPDPGAAGTTPVGTPPTATDRGTGTRTMTIETSRGTVRVRVAPARTPCTVASFQYLGQRGFFDNTPCHRLTTQGIFVLQCGDPTGTGTGGPGYAFADENLTGLGTPSAAPGESPTVTYPRGTVAMANAGPNTNGSQFFLVYRDSPLPPNYTPFGTVVGGLDVIDGVAARGADPAGDGRPLAAIQITRLTVS